MERSIKLTRYAISADFDGRVGTLLCPPLVKRLKAGKLVPKLELGNQLKHGYGEIFRQISEGIRG